MMQFERMLIKVVATIMLQTWPHAGRWMPAGSPASLRRVHAFHIVKSY